MCNQPGCPFLEHSTEDHGYCCRMCQAGLVDDHSPSCEQCAPLSTQRSLEEIVTVRLRSFVIEEESSSDESSSEGDEPTELSGESPPPQAPAETGGDLAAASSAARGPDAGAQDQEAADATTGKSAGWAWPSKGAAETLKMSPRSQLCSLSTYELHHRNLDLLRMMEDFDRVDIDHPDGPSEVRRKEAHQRYIKILTEKYISQR